MMKLEPLPLSRSLLESYRVRSRYQNRPGLIGGHRMRRKGQSLEFHEFRPYIPGDDIRHVDWSASIRHGGPNDFLVKTFVAEEQLTLIISIDSRPSMQLPIIMPKYQIAAWAVEALSWIALKSDDRVILHRLFGSSTGSIRELGRAPQSLSVSSTLKQFLEPFSKEPLDSEQSFPVNLDILESYLKPSVVWMIISDFYFDIDHQIKKLARRIASAQDGMRWLIVLDTDSWPYEKNLLGEGPRKIEGPGLPLDSHPLEVDTLITTRAEEQIYTHKRLFRESIARGSLDYITWKWPSEPKPDPSVFFEEHFGSDPVLQRLFMKDR